MARRPTVRDISTLSGVSTSTVSRVLTGRVRVSPEARAAVEDAIRRLNYRPNQLARSLKLQLTHTVGVLINDITNPFYGTMVRGIECEAQRAGYNVFLCNTNEDPVLELAHLHVLQDRRVDGIMLGPTGANAAEICALARRTPLVQVDRILPCSEASAVVVDNEQGAYRAVRMLIDKGYHPIAAFRWEAQQATISQRVQGYERALREAGFPQEAANVIDVPGLSVQQAAEIAAQVFAGSPKPRAIFALNNQIGLGIVAAARASGLKMPDDIALVVFDDIDIFALLDPPVAAVYQPAFQIGEQAMRLLLRQIQQPDSFVPETITLPTNLIQRQSA